MNKTMKSLKEYIAMWARIVNQIDDEQGPNLDDNNDPTHELRDSLNRNELTEKKLKTSPSAKGGKKESIVEIIDPKAVKVMAEYANRKVANEKGKTGETVDQEKAK